MEKIFDAYHNQYECTFPRKEGQFYVFFFWFLYFVILKQDYKLQKISHNFTPVPEKQECIPVKIADFTRFHAGKNVFAVFVKNASPSNMFFNK